MNMKLCVLLLALRVISGQKCDEPNESNECDISSHLHLAAKATKTTKAIRGSYLFSEFQPNPTGLLEDSQKVEFKGPPNTAFEGCVWSVEADGLPTVDAEGAAAAAATSFGMVDRVSPVSGTFDASGLLAVSIPALANPSFTIFLSQSCPKSNVNVFEDSAALLTAVQRIYDSVGVPDSVADAKNLPLIRTTLDNPPGTDLGYIGGEPKLVFRDASDGALYQVDDQGSASPSFVFDAHGTKVKENEFDPNPRKSSFGVINPSRFQAMGDITGDPHIHTLDGDHYTLLQEGSFLAWHFGLPQPHVEWQIFAHYAGRQSFTKGLLLIDTSGSEPSSMEITSERCEWQTKSNSKEWSSEVPEVLLSGTSSRMQLVGSQNKKRIELFIADEKDPVATLKVMCRQGRHINMKLYMTNQKWRPFVSGELKGQKDQKHKLSSNSSMLQLAVREDHEFEVKKTWAELGGSPRAQQYLQNLDDQYQTGKNAHFSQVCDPEAQADAKAICQKHLGSAAESSYFEECVFDVCSGSGEVAAEMAAEMLNFWAAPANNGPVLVKAKVVARLLVSNLRNIWMLDSLCCLQKARGLCAELWAWQKTIANLSGARVVT